MLREHSWGQSKYIFTIYCLRYGYIDTHTHSTNNDETQNIGLFLYIYIYIMIKSVKKTSKSGKIISQDVGNDVND